ncbi:MAG TPA: alkaline phosphatase family protein [Solirubrobacteraceae bacterium]
MDRSSRRFAIAGLAAVLVGVAGVADAQGPEVGRVGPSTGLLNNGRHLQPFGTLVTLGNFPTGGALTPNGRWYWTVSTGRGLNDVRIVSVRFGRVVQTIALPGASGGIAMDPTKPLVYISGVADSDHKAQKSPAGTPGIKGDVIHVYSYNPGTGSAHFETTIPVPPPSDAPAPQNFPPTNVGQKLSWPDRLAVSPDGSTLLVPLNLADAAAIVDVKTKAIRYVKTGAYPYGAAITPDGKTGLVSNETPGTVTAIDLPTGKATASITVGAHLSHPEGVTVSPDGKRAYVALANADQVIAIDMSNLHVAATMSVQRPQGIGAWPVDVTLTPDGRKLLVPEAGSDDIAVLRPSDLALIGRIPTAQYPVAVAVAGPKANPCGLRVSKRRGKKAKRCAKLVYVTGKGLGVGPNPQGPQPNSLDDSDDRINNTQYLPLLNIGAAGIADFPSDNKISQLTGVADAQIVPSNVVAQPPADTPLRPDGPIKHVFYIVRENRTYDQILGDDPRGDGDASLALFGGATTPNAHALAQRFPLVDHVYANSEASIDGHFWTSAGAVSDYVAKAWFQNYGGRGRPYDFGVYSVTWPGTGFLFDAAENQGISYFNYGEAIAGTVPLADRDRNSTETQEVAKKFSNSDLGPADFGNGLVPGQCYPNDASIGDDAINGLQVWDSVPPVSAGPQVASRFDCFKNRLTGQLATGTVPAFNYLVLSNDHTQTLSAGKRTPRAMIADNDEGLGRMVDLISHSSIWSSSAIFVIEDDSQDGPDHVDAHRMPAFVISPYARRGAVVHTRYDMLSVIRSMELIIGMKPLGLADSLGTPMYDAFSPTADLAPYDFVPAKVPLTETNPANTAGARAAARLPKGLDEIPQVEMDRLLWKSVHGWRSKPPPPGPNAVSGS